MEYQEVYERLKERALSFHKILVLESVYQKQLSEDDFLVLIEDELKDSAEGIACGRLDPWVNVLGFCEVLLFDIGDFLFTIRFDVMEGPKEHMEALQQLLSKAGYDFSWEIDDDANVVHFKIENIEWDGPCVDAWWAHEPPFSYGKPNLTDFLQNNGWFLYVAGTGDATARYLLVPPKSKEALKKYLIPGFSQVHPDFDPREIWLYEGVPENQRSDNLWEI